MSTSEGRCVHVNGAAQVVSSFWSRVLIFFCCYTCYLLTGLDGWTFLLLLILTQSCIPNHAFL